MHYQRRRVRGGYSLPRGPQGVCSSSSEHYPDRARSSASFLDPYASSTAHTGFSEVLATSPQEITMGRQHRLFLGAGMWKKGEHSYSVFCVAPLPSVFQ